MAGRKEGDKGFLIKILWHFNRRHLKEKKNPLVMWKWFCAFPNPFVLICFPYIWYSKHPLISEKNGLLPRLEAVPVSLEINWFWKNTYLYIQVVFLILFFHMIFIISEDILKDSESGDATRLVTVLTAINTVILWQWRPQILLEW